MKKLAILLGISIFLTACQVDYYEASVHPADRWKPRYYDKHLRDSHDRHYFDKPAYYFDDKDHDWGQRHYRGY